MFHKHIWFEEGPRRCCRKCGKIEVWVDPLELAGKPTVTIVQAESLRAKAGYNKPLHHAILQRTAWAVLCIFIGAMGAYQILTQGGLSVALPIALLIAVSATAFYSGRVVSLRRSQPSHRPE